MFEGRCILGGRLGFLAGLAGGSGSCGWSRSEVDAREIGRWGRTRRAYGRRLAVVSIDQGTRKP